MARNGNNLSQVFVANAILSDNEAMSALAAGEVGIFPNGTNVSDGAAGDVHIDATVATNPQWIPTQIQFAQGRATGNPLASPIIDTSQITRLDFTTYTAPVKAITSDVTITSTNNSTRFGLKIILKSVGPITNYTEYTDPSNQLNDRIGEIRNYEYTSDASATAIEIATGLANAINNDAFAFVEALQSGTDELQIKAKEFGTNFQVIDDGDTALAPTTLVGSYAGTEGVGAGWQVIDDEKKCAAKNGHMNRIWLPTAGTSIANSTWAYHRLDIQYKHNWPNSTGIAPSGELNTIRMYIGDGTTAMAHGDTVIDAQFLVSASGVLATTTHIFDH
jgi:hypothetical protein